MFSWITLSSIDAFIAANAYTTSSLIIISINVCLSMSLSGCLLPNYFTDFSRHSLIWKLAGMQKIMIFWQKIEKIGFFWFKSDFFDLNRFFRFFPYVEIWIISKVQFYVYYFTLGQSFEWVINLIDKILKYHVKNIELNNNLTNEKE